MSELRQANLIESGSTNNPTVPLDPSIDRTCSSQQRSEAPAKNMRIEFLPANEERPAAGSRQRPVIFVHIETPSAHETDERVAEFFGRKRAVLSMLEGRGDKIFAFLVHVHSVEELAPPSRYLEALCSFFREHPFAVVPRTPQRPLRLTVSVPEDGRDHHDDEDDDDRSNAALAEATSQICRAFWENPHVRASQFVLLDVAEVPSGAVVDLLLRGGRPSNNRPHVTLRVSDRPDGRMGPDALELELPGAADFVAAGASRVAAVARRVLAAAFKESATAPERIRVGVHSPSAAEAVAASLLEHRDHLCATMAFGVRTRRSALNTAGSDGRRPETTLDGTDLCAAVLQCPSVACVSFARFTFSPRTVAAVREIKRAAPGAGIAPIAILEFKDCSFVADRGLGTPASAPPGLCDLANAVACSSTLRCLHVTNTPLSVSDSSALVRVLVGREWDIRRLKLGGTAHGRDPYLERGFVCHFFQKLPLMKSLVDLTFLCATSADVSPTVLNGVKHNFSLRALQGLTFGRGLDPESSRRCSGEVTAYLDANARGREVVAQAVANPASRDLRDNAIEVIRQLADSDETTSLYLCLQLLLPSL